MDNTHKFDLIIIGILPKGTLLNCFTLPTCSFNFSTLFSTIFSMFVIFTNISQAINVLYVKFLSLASLGYNCRIRTFFLTTSVDSLLSITPPVSSINDSVSSVDISTCISNGVDMFSCMIGLVKYTPVPSLLMVSSSCKEPPIIISILCVKYSVSLRSAFTYVSLPYE